MLSSSQSSSSDAKIDLSVVAGGSLLSAQEGQICAQLGVIPAHYMTIKQILLSAATSRGFLRYLFVCCHFLPLFNSLSEALLILPGIPGEITMRLHALLVECGWLNPEPLVPRTTASDVTNIIHIIL
jgi:hypothetical protein